MPIIDWVIVRDGGWPIWEWPILGRLLGEATAFLSIAILVLFLLITLLGKRLISMEKRLAKLTPIDAKLDLLLKAAHLEYDPLTQLPGESERGAGDRQAAARLCDDQRGARISRTGWRGGTRPSGRSGRKVAQGPSANAQSMFLRK